jgi:uncharacterized protein YaaQ
LSSGLHANPTVDEEEIDTARREALRAQRSTLTSLLTDGVISDETYSQLVTEVDTALSTPQNTWAEHIRPEGYEQFKVERLMAAVVQEQDAQKVEQALERIGVSLSQLPTTGGFLGRKNVTFLIGFPRGQEEEIVQTLSKSSRRRVDFSSGSVEGLPLPKPQRVSVGGVTIFTFDVEDHQEF